MKATDLSFHVLKTRQREMRKAFPTDFGLRVHRAVSWIEGAEAASARGDADAAFICYWIAFNATYVQSTDLQVRFTEMEFREWFFEMICNVDGQGVVYDAIWQRFSGPLRLLLDNRYVYEPFWRHQHGEAEFANWRERFRADQRLVAAALRNQDTPRILGILFRRLYVLRNQLIHGGATWGGRVNRHQVADGGRVMACLVPHFVNLMMSHPQEAWGVPPYPPVDG